MELPPDLDPVGVRLALLRAVAPAEAVTLLDQGVPESYVLALHPLPVFKTQQQLLRLLPGGLTRGAAAAMRLLGVWRAGWELAGLDEWTLANVSTRAPVVTQQLRGWMWTQALSYEDLQLSDDDYNRPRILLRALAFWVCDGGEAVAAHADAAKQLDMLVRAAYLWADFTKTAQAF